MFLLLKFATLFIVFGYFGYIVTEEHNPFNINLRSSHEHLDAIYQRCTGTCNKKFCKIFVSCRPVNRTAKLRRVDIYFNEGVKLEAPILFEVSTFKRFRTQYRPLVVKYKEDFCKMLLMKSNPIFSFFNFNKTDGNAFDPCPISGHKYADPRITSTWVGTQVPIGEWRIDFIFTKVIGGVEDHILTVSYYILVKAKDAEGADEF